MSLQIREERGLFTCRKKTFPQESSITHLLEGVNLPEEVEIKAVKGYEAGYSEETTGNLLASADVQKAAFLPEASGILPLLPVTQLLPGGGGKQWRCCCLF